MIEVSPSSLNILSECPRCFWLSINQKLNRPSGPFPSLPRGLDNLIKKYFDSYRAKGNLPPEIEGKVKGCLIEDQGLLDEWRNWRKGLRFEDDNLNILLCGALDECLVDGKLYIPVDYKTRGYDLKEDTTQFYQSQLDCYTLLLEENGYKTPSFAYLVFYIPKVVTKNGIVNFNVEVVELKTDKNRAKDILKEAAGVLSGPIPPSHSECDFCSWARRFANF